MKTFSEITTGKKDFLGFSFVRAGQISGSRQYPTCVRQIADAFLAQPDGTLYVHFHDPVVNCSSKQRQTPMRRADFEARLAAEKQVAA